MGEEPAGDKQTTPSARVTILEGALMEDMGDEAVILNINNERYYGLDDVGIKFWKWLKEDGDVDLVLERAKATFGIDEATLKQDIGVFVLELNQAGLLTFDES